jgi:hypothetical protein
MDSFARGYYMATLAEVVASMREHHRRAWRARRDGGTSWYIREMEASAASEAAYARKLHAKLKAAK